MATRVLTWNLFHGRDFAPDPKLRTWRSRILRFEESNATHLQVNRDLLEEFVAVLAGASWDIAFLQESPPRWAVELARRSAAEPHIELTSRNALGAVRGLLAKMNPDLIASNEGGSNLTLVRRAAGRISDRRLLELRPGPNPERRVMVATKSELAAGGTIFLANLHASAGAKRRPLAEAELLHGAEVLASWADDAPLIFGGDLNVRPRDSRVFEQLEQCFGLVGATSPDSLDHLLVRGLECIEPATAWPAARREIARDGLAIRLSDHAPVEACFTVG